MIKKLRSKKYLVFAIILMIVLGLSVGFAALQRQLLIDDSIFNVRLQRDTRVSASVITKTGGDAVSNYEDYNVSKIFGSVNFPSTSSYVLYKVDLTNYGNVKTGLLSITSNTSGVNYQVCDSNGSNCSANPKTAICNGNNCTLGSTKQIYVKVTTSSAGTKNVDLDLDFEPYNNITYTNIRENTSSFQSEIMTNDTYNLTLASKPEEVDITGNVTYTYNKNTGVLNISHVESDININARYSATDVADPSYNGTDPDNYILLDQELYRIVTRENVNDGYGNTEFRVKLIKETSIGNNQFDGLSNEFGGSNINAALNTYYGSMSSTAKSLIDTAQWTESYSGYVGLITGTNYTTNSSWIPNNGYTVTKAENNQIVAITSSGLIDSATTVSRATYPCVYLKTTSLVVGGSGTKSNPYVLDTAGSGLQPNPTRISGGSLTVTGSNQNLVTVEDQVGTPRYSLTTPLNASNYTDTSISSTTIPQRSAVGSYTIYYYIPEVTGFKAKQGQVHTTINGLTFIITYQKGANVSSIGKNGDSCTTTGSNLSCNVTLPTITPNQGYENGKWNYNSNQYNPGSSFALDSSKNGITLTATASGSTYTATFNKNGATTISSTSLSCTVTSGDSCTINTSPSITREGYTIHGWSTDQNAHTGITAGGALTLSGNTTYYAITSKEVTLTFNRNGNTSQTVNGGTASTATTVTDSCTIWNNTTECNITAPTITMEGYTIHGYSSGATTYTNYWACGTQRAVSDNYTWYAQTSIAAKTVTITFNRNGNTSQTPKNGTASTATTIQESCTIAAARNGASQDTSCSVTSPTINMSGFEVIGYSTSNSNHTSSWAQNTAKNVSENATYFAQTKKDSITRTITFNKNGNTSFVYNSTTYTDNSKTFDACTIPEVYNGATQANSCTATLTMPTINAPSGFDLIGWSAAADTHTASYTSGQANASVTMNSNKTFFAQSTKAQINRTITFYKNGNTNFTYSGTTYTDASKTFTVCTIAATYNGDSQASSCSATITMPTMTAASGFTTIGWSTSADNHIADYTSGQANVSFTMNSNKSYYAQSSKAGADRTITFYKNGNTAFTYNSNRYTDTSKTFTACTIDTVYNGASQSSSCTAAINMPTIEAASGFDLIGWSAAADTHTATYTSGQSNVSITMNNNKSYYAQSTKTAIERKITFYKNGNTNFKYNGTTYTDASKSFTVCTIAATYNGTAQGTSCSATITMPTITAASGFTTIGWNSSQTTYTAQYTSGQASVSFTMSSDKSFYAHSSKAGFDRTITFYRNGNTSFVYNSTTYTDTYKTFTACSVPTVYNGATQATSCTANLTMPTINPPSGFTNIGWSGGATNYTATYTSGQANVSINMTGNKTYYAQSSKAGKTVTMTFYKNGNVSQTKNGGSASTAASITDSCSIPTVYNGATQASTCSITSPTITSQNGFTVLGYSDGETNRTITWNHNTAANVSNSASYYAQSKKDITVTYLKGVNVTSIGNDEDTCTLYNSDTSCHVMLPTITPAADCTSVGWNTTSGATTGTAAGSLYEVTSTITLYANAKATEYTVSFNNNGGSGGQSTSVNAIYGQAMPTISTTAPTKQNYTFMGWYDNQNYTNGTQYYTAAGASAKNYDKRENTTLYAGWSLNDPATPTITGGGTSVYGNKIELTCATSTTYASGATVRYQFGFSTTNGGNPGSWTDGDTSPTYLAQNSYTTRYYSCRVIVDDGEQTSNIVTSLPSENVQVTYVNARIDFDATTNGGTISGTTPLYARYANANLYTGRSNTTTSSKPTATKAGWNFDGWYTEGGTKVINADGTLVASVSGWTNASSQFVLTNASNTANTNKLVAHFTPKTFTATFYYNSNTTSGSITAATTTAQCTVSSGSTCTVTVPTVVQNSVGKYNSAYHGVSVAINSMEDGSLVIGEDTTFYTNYSSALTIYYPKNDGTVSSTNTALYRNEVFTNTSATAMNTVTSNENNSTTQATTVTISDIRGTFLGLATSANTSTYYAVNNETNIINTSTKTFYAVSQGTENAVIHYNSNTTSGSFTDATANAPVESVFFCASTTTQGATHGTTTTIPSAVTSSVGKYNSAYKGISSSSSTITNATTFTGGSNYYAYYSSPITIYYPKNDNTIASTNTVLYRNEYYSSTTAMTTRTCTSQTTTTQATSITLPNLKGTLSGINHTANTNTAYAVNNSSNVVNRNNTTFYAVSTGSEDVTFYYNTNTTSGSLTVSTVTSSVTSTFRCQNTTTMYTTHGSTTDVPSEVSSSIGKYNSPYIAVTAVNSMTPVTTFVGGNKYYASYSTGVTIYYPATTTTRSSYAYYRNEYFTSDSAMTAVINSSQTDSSNFTFSSSVSGYSLFGFANSANTNSKNYNNVSALALSDKATTYAVLYKEVTVTFYYNSSTTCNTTTISTATNTGNQFIRCTDNAAEISNGAVNIPAAVTSSVGPHNAAYKAIAPVNTMTGVSNTTANAKYYAIYSSEVTLYYYNPVSSVYTNRTLYRNEYFTSDSAMTAALAINNDSTSNYSTSGDGPNSSTWYGLADTATATRKYSTVSAAASSNTCTTTLYTIYQYSINYQKGSNVSEIGATNGACQFKYGDSSCDVTLPTITPNTNYMSVGWNTTSGATSGTSAGSSYTITTNVTVPTLYANAIAVNYKNMTTNAEYNTLSAALSAVANNQTIKVLNNVTETTVATLASGKAGIKLDTNGKTITFNNAMITNNGTLDIYNSSSTDGTISGSDETVITNNGTLTINGTSTTNKTIITSTYSSMGQCINNASSKSLTVNANAEVNANVGVVNFGNMTINGGLVYGLYGINNNTGAQLTINNANSIVGSTYDYGINNSGTITMSAGQISATGTAIENSGTVNISGGTIGGSVGISNSGTVTITSGNITGSSYGINNTSGGTVTLGTNDSNVSTTSPMVESTYNNPTCYGFKNSGTFNFYDGIIKSASGTGKAISGTVSSTTTGFEVYKETTNGVESAYLLGNYLNTSTNVSYATLKAAINGSSSNQTIKVVRDVTETTNASNGKTGLKLDLNGKTITMNNVYITNNGSLDIYNSSSTDGKISGGADQLIWNYGTLTLNGTSSANKVTIEKSISNNNFGAIYNNYLNSSYPASLTVNNNAEIQVSNSSSYGVYNYIGTVTMNGGSITAQNGIYNIGIVSVSGGTITAYSFAGIYNTSKTESGETYSGTTTISGGTVTCNSGADTFGIANEANMSVTGGNINGCTAIGNSGTLTVTGGTITGVCSSIRGITTSSLGIINNGTITISGGTIVGSNGIKNISTGNISVSGSTTQITGSFQGIWNLSTLTVSGGTITGDSNGIQNSGTVTITGGSISGENVSGILNESGATITLGDNTEPVSTTSPLIQATGTSTSYGVNNSGTFNFYDGIIKSASGTGKAISGTISNVPNNYMVHAETLSGVESAWLISGLTVSFNNNGGSGGQSADVIAFNGQPMPAISTTAPTKAGYTFMGWYDNQNYTLGTQYYTAAGASARNYDKTANTTLYAGWSINDPDVPTISGDSIKVYNYEDISLTCSTTTTYSSDTTLYYEYGYATTSANYTNGNITWTGNVRTTPTGTITKAAFKRAYYYGCRIYATDPNGISSNTVQATTPQTVGLYNARINFDYSTNGGSLVGSYSAVYVEYGGTATYSARTGSIARTVPTATKANYHFDGWYTAASGGTKVIDENGVVQASVSGWTNSSKQWLLTDPTNDATVNILYAHFSLNAIADPIAPTISGGTTKIYNYSSTTLTCALGETVPSGKTAYYQFGYATSTTNYNNSSITWIGSPSTTQTTLTIAKDEYRATRYYGCRVYYTDGTNTSNSIKSSYTTMGLVNRSLTFNVSSNSGTISGSSTLYISYNLPGLFTSSTGTTAGTIPTATKENYIFKGWYTATSGGYQVIDREGVVQASVSGWTDASKNFLRTSNSTLYAQFISNTPATFYYNSNTTSGSYTWTSVTSTCNADGTVSLPSVVSNSVGVYNFPFGGITTSNDTINPTTTYYCGTTYYSYYSEPVTILNYYNSSTSSFTTTTLYKNEYLQAINSAFVNVVSNSPTGATNYSWNGPGNSGLVGYSRQNNLNSVMTQFDAGRSDATQLYAVYQMRVNYSAGMGVSAIGATYDTCRFTGTNTSCSVTLPSITPGTNFTSVGWSLTNGDTTGVTGTYTLTSSNTTLYANAIANYINITAGTGHTTLSDALSNVASSQTIKVMVDRTESSASLASGITGVVLDLNGHTINMGSTGISNNGTLTIKSTGGASTITSSYASFITNTGTLTINGTNSTNSITLTNTSNANNTGVVVLKNDGTATLTGYTTLQFSRSSNASRYVINNNGPLTISGATINASVSGGRDSGIKSTGNITFSSGSITATNNNGVGIDLNYSNTITMSGGTITARSYGITSGGTMTITGGTISCTNGYGIYNDRGTLTLGVKNSTVNTTSPAISVTTTSGTYGIYNYHFNNLGYTFKFYDGIVQSAKGTGYAIYGDPSDLPNGYEVQTTTSNGTETAILVQSGSKGESLEDTSELGKLSRSISNAYEDIVYQIGDIVEEQIKASSSNETKSDSTLKTDDVNYISSTSKFLGTDILRGEIRSIRFSNSIDKHKSSDKNTWDVSSYNDESILLWIDKSTDGYYDIVIGSSGGVVLPSNSSYLFSYLTSLEDIDFTNTIVSNVNNINGIVYRSDKLNDESIESLMSIAYKVDNNLTLSDLGIVSK